MNKLLSIIIPYYNVEKYIKEFGKHGTFELLNLRPTDSYPYPCNIIFKDNTVSWSVSISDVAYEGLGRCELHYYLNGAIVKSETWDTRILPSITDIEEELPDVYESWVQQILKSGTDAVNAKKAIEALEVEANTLPEGQPATVHKEVKEDHVKIVFGIPKGDKPVAGIDYYTEEDKQEIENDSAKAALKAVTDQIDEKLEEAKTELETSFLSFEVEDDGNLWMTKSSKLDVDFSLNEKGELIYEF